MGKLQTRDVLTSSPANNLVLVPLVTPGPNLVGVLNQEEDTTCGLACVAH